MIAVGQVSSTHPFTLLPTLLSAASLEVTCPALAVPSFAVFGHRGQLQQRPPFRAAPEFLLPQLADEHFGQPSLTWVRPIARLTSLGHPVRVIGY